jgi:MscS family membrane protein
MNLFKNYYQFDLQTFLEKSRFDIWFNITYTVLIIFIIFYFVRKFTIKKIEGFIDEGRNSFTDKFLTHLKSIGIVFYLFLDIFLVFQIFEISKLKLLNSFLVKSIENITIIVLTYYLVGILNHLFLFCLNWFTNIKNSQGPKLEVSVIETIGLIFKILVWILAIVFILQKLGYDVTTLVAGLGIGGIAFAFAMQNILGDLFASIAIHMDKPFTIGQTIQFQDTIGKVKKVGIKSTRIETLDGEEYIISNKILTDSSLKNYTKMNKRRSLTILSISYKTDKNKIKLIPKILKEILSKLKKVELVRVHFSEFATYSINFELVYYVLSSDYIKYMDIKEQINLLILEEFDKNNILFAFPSQSIFLESNLL